MFAAVGDVDSTTYDRLRRDDVRCFPLDGEDVGVVERLPLPPPRLPDARRGHLEQVRAERLELREHRPPNPFPEAQHCDECSDADGEPQDGQRTLRKTLPHRAQRPQKALTAESDHLPLLAPEDDRPAW